MIVKELLFSSSRTMNRNEVHYYIQYDGNTGAIYSPEPITCEWVMYEVDGTGGVREPLTLMERELLYGTIIVKQDSSPPRVVFAITGLPEFPITVFQQGTKYVSGVKLPSGQLGLLNHVHGIMENSLIKGLEVSARVSNGSLVQEWLPINRTVTA
jgi:hypothetical protein